MRFFGTNRRAALFCAAWVAFCVLASGVIVHIDHSKSPEGDLFFWLGVLGCGNTLIALMALFKK